MSVKIRLAKVGKTHQISYRIVATDTRSKRDGKFLEILGFYNPHNKPELQLDKEKLAFWTKKGARPTPAVENLIKEGKLIKKTSKRKLKQEVSEEVKTKPSTETQKEEPKQPESQKLTEPDEKPESPAS